MSTYGFCPLLKYRLHRASFTSIHNWFSHTAKWSVKLRSHVRGAVAERRRADLDIPAPLPWVCSHIRGADAGGSAISCGRRWFGARGFEANAENWVLDPFVVERILLPLRLRSATAYVWTHVVICVEANFPSASARVLSAHVWTYLNTVKYATVAHIRWQKRSDRRGLLDITRHIDPRALATCAWVMDCRVCVCGSQTMALNQSLNSLFLSGTIWLQRLWSTFSGNDLLPAQPLSDSMLISCHVEHEKPINKKVIFSRA